MAETCRVSWQSKFWIFDASSWLFYMKLITMHGHLNIKMWQVVFAMCHGEVEELPLRHPTAACAWNDRYVVTRSNFRDRDPSSWGICTVRENFWFHHLSILVHVVTMLYKSATYVLREHSAVAQEQNISTFTSVKVLNMCKMRYAKY
jgi:hypothetical protein